MNMEARLAVLEAKVDDLRTEAHERETKQDEILDTVNQLQKDIATAKSAFGAVLWLIGGMVAALWKIGPWLLGLLRVKTGHV